MNGVIIAIRADGNSDIGFGHLVRMQALARQLEKRGAKVLFLSRNPENITDYAAQVISSGESLVEEDDNIARMLKQCKADMLIIDSYAYNQERLDKIASLDLLTVYIDDMNLHEFNVDFVVNGNLYAPKLEYRGRSSLLLGNKYLLMREEFSGIVSRTVNDPVQNVLVSFGAADMENITCKVLEALFAYDKFAQLKWHVVIGPVFRKAAEIEILVRDKDNVFLHYNPAIKDLMFFCDIAISAAGSTIYELAACGVPAIVLIAAENQIKLAGEADCLGFARNLGWHRDWQSDCLFKALDSLINDHNARQEMAAKGQSLIDGAGAGRVADRLLEALKKR